MHRRPDLQVVAVAVAAVEDDDDRGAQVADQPAEHPGHVVDGGGAERPGLRLAVEAGVPVAQQLDPGGAEPLGRTVQLGLADRAEVGAVGMPGQDLAGLPAGGAGDGHLGAPGGRPRDGRPAAERLVVGMGDGHEPAVAGSHVEDGVTVQARSLTVMVGGHAHVRLAVR